MSKKMLSLGSIVESPKFGIGTVTNVDPTSSAFTYEVTFNSGAIRFYPKNYSVNKLHKI